MAHIVEIANQCGLQLDELIEMFTIIYEGE